VNLGAYAFQSGDGGMEEGFARESRIRRSGRDWTHRVENNALVTD
jgi:hypothetical protein